jgi:hypothetical protein
MKKLLLITILLLYAIPGTSKWFNKELEQPEKPTVCFYSTQVSGENETAVFYVFKGGCEGFFQVGIIEQSRIITLDRNLKELSNTTYSNTEIRNDDVNQKWPDLQKIKFFIQ